MQNDLQAERPLWVLSCYASERDRQNDLTGDVSPEEVGCEGAVQGPGGPLAWRALASEARASCPHLGTHKTKRGRAAAPACALQVRWANMQAVAGAGASPQQLATEFKAARQAKLDQFTALCRAQRLPSAGGPAIPEPSSTISGVGGTAPAGPAGGGFGQPAAAGAAFGQPAAATGAGFGQAAAAGGGFGQPAAAGGGFGQPAAAGGGGFGQPAKFGTSSFGQPATAGGGGFGQPAAASTPAGGR